MSTAFQFKQFSVRQDQCAMKIGTDGVLLAAWANLQHHPSSILDIGAGTGLIALMLAQRSTAELIDAVEIEDNAYMQCVKNFENSPWGDRLFCYHAGFEELAAEPDEPYELIISNPPFFAPPQQATEVSEARKTARFTTRLSYKELISGSARLLAESGQFAVIVPYKAQKEVVELAASENLYLYRQTNVKGNPNAPFKRCLLQFGFAKKEPQVNELIIEIERHQYTPAYKALTQDFYLNM